MTRALGYNSAMTHMPMAPSAPTAPAGRPSRLRDSHHFEGLLLAALTVAHPARHAGGGCGAAAATERCGATSVAGQPAFAGSDDLLAQQQTVDPIGLLLIVAALACLLAYLLVSEFMRPGRGRRLTKLALIWAIILLTVFASSLKLTLLRQQSGPASYSHDGGVIQTEATIDYLLAGRNPTWRITRRPRWPNGASTSSAPRSITTPTCRGRSCSRRSLASEALLGWYDQRFVYLLLFALTLILATRLTASAGRQRLLLMLLGLNPLLGSDVIFGQNDSFVLVWLVLSFFLWRQGARHAAQAAACLWQAGAAIAFGLACASKPTAWFLAPFYLMLLAGGDPRDLWRRPIAWAGRALRVGWPALATALVIIGPYVLWQPAAMIDDVWRWSAGTSDTAYQIWGWGASNLLLAAGWVSDRFAYWPFWIPELVVGSVLLAALLKKQAGANTPARVLWGYSLWLLAFFFITAFSTRTT